MWVYYNKKKTICNPNNLGSKKGWVFQSMYRLSRVKSNNYKKQISHTLHRLVVGRTPWRKILFKIGFKVRLLPSPSKIRGCAKNSFQTHKGHYEFKVMSFGLTNAPATPKPL
jgi:hypothetical protein